MVMTFNAKQQLEDQLCGSVSVVLKESGLELNKFDYERWLSANNYDLPRATKQLTYHLRFIKSALAYEVDPLLKKAAPVWIPGCVDRDRNLMVVSLLGKYDARGLERLSCITPAAFCIYQVLQYFAATRRVRALESETGVRHGIHVVFDVAELKLGIFELVADMERMYRPFMQLISKHLKGMARKFSVINTNFLILDIFVPIARRLLPPTWRELLSVSTRSEIIAVLQQSFDPSQLPLMYGGVYSDGEPVTSPIPIPADLLVPLESRDHGRPAWSIPVGQSLRIVHRLEQGKAAKLTFKLWFSMSCDFGLYYDAITPNNRPSAMDPLFPEMRPWAHGRYLWEEYSMECHTPGYYVIFVSNSRALLFNLHVCGNAVMRANSGILLKTEVVIGTE